MATQRQSAEGCSFRCAFFLSWIPRHAWGRSSRPPSVRSNGGKFVNFPFRLPFFIFLICVLFLFFPSSGLCSVEERSKQNSFPEAYVPFIVFLVATLRNLLGRYSRKVEREKSSEKEGRGPTRGRPSWNRPRCPSVTDVTIMTALAFSHSGNSDSICRRRPKERRQKMRGQKK